MIDVYANRIAVAIKNANKEETASVEVMQYGLVILFNGISILSLSFIIGMMTGMFYETLITCIIFAVIRQLSGGFHFNSGMLCIITSTLLLSTLPHIPVTGHWITILTLISLPSFLAFAPSGIDQQTRIPRKYYPVLKVVCVILVFSNFFIFSGTIAKVLFTQAILIVKLRRREQNEENCC